MFDDYFKYIDESGFEELTIDKIVERILNTLDEVDDIFKLQECGCEFYDFERTCECKKNN